LISANSGIATAGLFSPKGAVTLGPWHGTEGYINAGLGFHSNDARGTTIVVSPDGEPVERVTPLVRAKGAELGVRRVLVPHLQSTLSLWTLRLDSELVYNGDLGATEPGPASKRHGVELANYYSPTPWLIFDGDVSWSQARFDGFNEAGPYIPEAVNRVVSAGASVDNYRRLFGSLRLRYFGPRPLVEDNSARSEATTLLNVEGGISGDETHARERRGVQPRERAGERHRLLFHVATSRRTFARCGRHSHASDGATHCARDARLWFLSSTVASSWAGLLLRRTP